MKDPIEIAATAIMLSDGCGLQFGVERTFCDDTRAGEDRPRRCDCKQAGAAAVAALEAAGFVIVRPDEVTEQMAQSAFDVVAHVFKDEGCEPSPADWKLSIKAALRAARRYGGDR